MSIQIFQLLNFLVFVVLAGGSVYSFYKKKYHFAAIFATIMFIMFTMMPVRQTVDNGSALERNNTFEVPAKVEVEEELPFEERQEQKLKKLNERSKEITNEITQ